MVRTNTREYKILRELLSPSEVPSVEIVERRLGGAKLFGTAHAYATNKRIIIIRRYIFGVHKSLKIIKYSDITEIKIERGLVFCRLHFTLHGEQPDSEDSHKWFMGVKYKEALEIIQHINKIEEKPIAEV